MDAKNMNFTPGRLCLRRKAVHCSGVVAVMCLVVLMMECFTWSWFAEVDVVGVADLDVVVAQVRLVLVVMQQERVIPT
eukprot:6475504-Amphidinium_carterae.1